MITQTTGESNSCRWRAPEVFEEKAAVSAKGDIYSFGMTILEVGPSALSLISWP